MILSSSLVSAEKKNVKNLGQSSYNNVQSSCHQVKENLFHLFKGLLDFWIINAKAWREFLIRGFFSPT